MKNKASLARCVIFLIMFLVLQQILWRVADAPGWLMLLLAFAFGAAVVFFGLDAFLHYPTEEDND